MATPLAGIRVLDLTNVLAGPFCTHQLAHFGADVIKVEIPEKGDLARQLGADEDLSSRNLGISFLAPNPGKRSLTLNLKSEKGRELLFKLVRTADVLVENFRPGVMDRLGVGYERLRQERQSLVYCAISGFGQSGPMKHRPAYDQIIQGMSGAMSITGDAETAPLRAGWPVADTVGGLTAAMAICAALNAPEKGAYIDVSMLDSLLATMGWAVSNLLIGGVPPTPAGNENLTSAPSGAFECSDGLLNIAANKQEQWEALARHIGCEDLMDDPRFRTRPDRKANRIALKDKIEDVLKTRPSAEWESELNALGIPSGRILSVADALDHPAFVQREQIGTYEFADGTVSRSIRTGVHFDGGPLTVSTPPPELGADTEDILREIGLSPTEISACREEGIL